MDSTMIIVFFALLFLLLGMTHRAGITILFWSLLGFIIVASVFMFYQYVHEYEKTHGKGTWAFDPFAMMRRSRTTRVGQLQESDIKRVRRIMRELGYTEGEIDSHIALLEETSDTNLNELLLIEDAIDEARRQRGGLTAAEKITLLQRFKDGISSSSPAPETTPPETTPPETTPPETTPPETTPAPPPPLPPQPPQPICNVAKGSADLEALDYHLFRPQRAHRITNECAKCVVAEFDSMSPESIMPKTPLEYTKMLLGDRRTAINRIVEAAQGKCFAKEGADKDEAVRVLTRTFDVYFFGNSSPTLPKAAQDYLLDLHNNPPAVPADYKSCTPSDVKMREQQDDMTVAVHALYRTYQLAVDDARAQTTSVAVSRNARTLENLFARKSGLPSGATFNSLDYLPVEAPASVPVPAAAAPASNFEAEKLKESISAMLDARNDPNCQMCIAQLGRDMKIKIQSERFSRISRGLRHNPILKTTFLVQFMQTYFRHYTNLCASTNTTKANINLTIYARKLLAMTQLWWSVILQGVYADL